MLFIFNNINSAIQIYCYLLNVFYNITDCLLKYNTIAELFKTPQTKIIIDDRIAYTRTRPQKMLCTTTSHFKSISSELKLLYPHVIQY